MTFEVQQNETGKVLGEYETKIFPAPTMQIKVGNKNYIVKCVDLLQEVRSKETNTILRKAKKVIVVE